MSAAAATTVVWVAPPGGQAPSAAALHALSEWADARGVRLASPVPSPVPALTVDPSIGDAVEVDLEQAREAITEQNAPLADAALERAEALLRGHPELPQAAWLLAEVLRGRATRGQSLAPRDEARSAAMWARAALLDSGRAAGVGEVRREEVQADPSRATAVLVFDGERPGEAPMTVTLDGRPSGATLTAPRGEHHVRVSRNGALVWAAWVTLGEERTIAVPLPRAVACSGPDVDRAHLVDGAVVASGVACDDWVFAHETPGSQGELHVATCRGGSCGPLLQWKVGRLGPVAPDWHAHERGWPAWATWAIVGAGAVAVAGATLAASGVFRPTHDQPVFVTDGLHVATDSLRLGK